MEKIKTIEELQILKASCAKEIAEAINKFNLRSPIRMADVRITFQHSIIDSTLVHIEIRLEKY